MKLSPDTEEPLGLLHHLHVVQAPGLGCFFALKSRTGETSGLMGVLSFPLIPPLSLSLPPQNKDDGVPELKHFRGDGEEKDTGKHKELKLRNYAPEDEELKGRVVPKAKPASVEDKVKEQLEAAKPEPIIEEVDLANLAPRKPDWDLKRDVAKKLEKLEKRTQRAIAELIRERLRGQEEDLASAVDSAKQEGSDSD
ncbi:coiled-coil domain-containing protein 12 isoform X2 [Zootoca vivipara]|uniref:coiled-coil domain-containing protein 12 isoform X2 n=1 Tax=Zootoca vivipara TaxID=8524 RepID=UPI00158FF118|nr:coiled-coil domain-containing protein 12 isoform X2 [Zootoca vivipara]XP_060136982.1 coiled-coil domain-containing protein 12 isoform X2 [Zootoca vivipara]